MFSICSIELISMNSIQHPSSGPTPHPGWRPGPHLLSNDLAHRHSAWPSTQCHPNSTSIAITEHHPAMNSRFVPISLLCRSDALSGYIGTRMCGGCHCVGHNSVEVMLWHTMLRWAMLCLGEAISGQHSCQAMLSEGNALSGRCSVGAMLCCNCAGQSIVEGEELWGVTLCGCDAVWGLCCVGAALCGCSTAW